MLQQIESLEPLTAVAGRARLTDRGMEHEPTSRVIHVEIHGQRYPIRSALDAQYVAELAAFVDEKMRLAARSAPRAIR